MIDSAAMAAAAPRLKVALYYPWVYLTSGAERTILELTGRSRHEWTIYTNHFDAGATFPEFASRRVVELAPRVSVRRSFGHVAHAAWTIASQRLPVQEHDAIVVVCEGLGDFAMFRSSGVPAICLCLTPVRAVFDEVYRERARAMRGSIGRAVLDAGSWLYAAIDRQAWKRYRRVFCISDEIRRRAVAGRLAPADKLEVLHVGLGIEGAVDEATYEPFFLVPGRIMWTKNLELAIEAFRMFRATTGDRAFRLVIAGMVDQKSEPYLDRLRSAAGPGVEFVVAPSDAELRRLYQTCYAAVFPAFNEDWGIVPLEAMSFGKVVVATDRGGPREIIRHGRDGFLEKPTAEAFAARMRALAADRAAVRRMRDRAAQRAAQFSWGSFTQRIDEAIDALAPSTTTDAAPASTTWPSMRQSDEQICIPR